jgi:hypothetical protein
VDKNGQFCNFWFSGADWQCHYPILARQFWWPWSSQGLAKSWRHISLMLVGVAAAAISVSPASATMQIIADPGGSVIDYVERFEAARVSGEPIIIDGACLSACTLAIGRARGLALARDWAILRLLRYVAFGDEHLDECRHLSDGVCDSELAEPGQCSTAAEDR